MLDLIQSIIAESLEEILRDSKDDGEIESFSVKAEDCGRVLVNINSRNFFISIEETTE